MIFNLRKIKHQLKENNSLAEQIKNKQKEINQLKTLNRMMNQVWNEFISNTDNTELAIQAFKTLKYNSEDIQLIQSYLKYLLKNLDKICREHGIKYWFRGGSLLGLIRHGGFIPWDDDIDIGMMRDDMYKLMEVLKDTDFGIVYHFNDTVPQSICRMPRFINKNNGINMFIDIFPFDYTEENEKNALATYWTKRRTLYNEISPRVNNGEIGKYLGLMYEDNSKDLDKLNEIFDRYTEKKQKVTKHIVYPFDWFDTTQNLYYNTSDIFPLKELKFDNEIDVYIPNDHIIALSMCYNNYLEFPSSFVDHKDTHKLLENKKFIKKFLTRENIRASK